MATDLCVLQTDPRGNVMGFVYFQQALTMQKMSILHKITHLLQMGI